MVFDRRDWKDNVKYNPHRDIAYVYSDLLVRAEKITLNDKWAPLTQILAEHDVDPEEVAEAWVALAQFMNEGQDLPDMPMQDLLDKNGWFQVNPMANVAVCATIGRVMIGAYCTAMRDTFDRETDKPRTREEIADAGESLARHMSRSRLTRWLRSKYYRVKKRLLRSHDG
jgi:hypothetical protein